MSSEFEVQSTLNASALDKMLGEWDTGASAYVALAERIRLLVIDGRIATRTRLPSERELAERLGRSRTTIVAAYKRLRESGHLVSVRGSGSVTRMPRSQRNPVDHEHGGVIDMSRAVPSPISGLDAIIRRTMEDIPSILARPGIDLSGDPTLRAMIADRFTARGLPTTPDQVMVTIGAQHAISLIARTLVSPGDRVLIESPTYPHAYETLRASGARFVTTPIMDGAWDAARLRESMERARPTLAYLIPEFHNPTGAWMTPEVREVVVDSASRSGTILLIDETMGDLDIDRGFDVPSVATYARRDTTVVTVGSLSKSVWGGMRVGWIRADAELIHSFVAMRPTSDMGSPHLDQAVAMETFGELDAIIERRTAQLHLRRDHLAAELRARIPEWGVPDVVGGLSLWVNLGAPLSSGLALAARSRGLLVTAGPNFGVDGAFERFMRLPYTLSEPELTAAAQILQDSWRSLGSVPSASYEQGLVAVV
ncbi:MAG: PLP-dependent aminotransferase family protein [Nocardioidaceae bacterium]|nr:PLP-dependent aminotransferase family protein [Nocardioidaceae bacterium]